MTTINGKNFSEAARKALAEAGLRANVIESIRQIEIESEVTEDKGVAKMTLYFSKTSLWVARAATLRIAAALDEMLFSAPDDVWPQDPYFTNAVEAFEASENAYSEIVLTGEAADRAALLALLTRVVNL